MVALAVGISTGAISVLLLSILLFTGCLIWVYKWQTKDDIHLARYYHYHYDNVCIDKTGTVDVPSSRYSIKNGEASFDLHINIVDINSADENEILKLKC